MNRRSFLKTGALGSLAVAGQAIGSNGNLTSGLQTPKEIEGPFYPVIAQQDKDFDLTKVKGRKAKALGQHIVIHGVVIDTEGNPVEGATVDLWQANAAGRYLHPHDSNSAPVDDNFQGWAIVPSGRGGGFRFRTVFPGIYPVGGGWSRPPHIHFKVTKKGYIELTTQMYFPGHPLNQVDRLLQRKSKQEQKLMIAEKSSDKPDTFYYQIIVEKA
jgi:protocatechuate 3,4-dioxygenase beta subunit